MLVAALLAAAAPATVAAQTPTAVLRPIADGDPHNPQRFRKAEIVPRSQLLTFGAAVGSGAGATGFDSTNLRQRNMKAGKQKSARPAYPVSAPNTRVPRPPALARAERDAGSSLTPAPRPPFRRHPEPDAFTPLGIRTGPLLWRSAVELGGGYDTNPARVRNGSGSSLFAIAPELQLRSEWSRHELHADLRGSYAIYPSTPSLDRPALDGKLGGRIDVSRQTNVDLETRVLVGTDNPGSPNLRADLAKLPIFTTFGGSAGVAHRFNRFEIAAKANVDRTLYQESELTDGTMASNDDRNYNQYGGQLRGSYELLPGVKPFVQIGASSRVHDTDVDSAGFRRDSRGLNGQVGSSFALTPLLTGEAALGYLTRHYDDPHLPDISGLLVDASLIWTASALTTVKLAAQTSVDESTVPGVSGTFRRDFGVAVDHSFRRWLIGSLKFGYGVDDYVGSDRVDQRYLASAALIYKINRALNVKGEVRQEWMRSTDSAADYTASIFLVGMRLQR